ncbi:MAG: YitT family protein [Oscillospiraceae bacterium]|nr:YitT family protein [Oscillospiraceae bacterium]MCI8807813.1 YitT family protein [Oscillospiraceae bacterium]MCI9549495.1 YitT family protein [Oscillospiraceae bacterium]
MSHLKKTLLPVLIITLGSAVYALGFVWCYAPNGIAFGGITGVAQIVNFLIPALPIGVTVIVLNIPLFVLGWRLIGGRLLVTSLYAMALSSVFIDVLTPLYDWPPMEPLLACIFGGVLLGLSLGLVFQQGATTGGTDLLARLLKLKLAWLPMGKLLMGIDLAVIVAVAAAFRALDAALYGLVALYISTIVMDGVLYGLDTAKVAYIISDRNKEISAAIVKDLDRGVTILHGQGAYTGADKDVLMCAFKQREIAAIKAAVKDIDPAAFVIVCDAHEVLGEGFRDYKKDDL